MTSLHETSITVSKFTLLVDVLLCNDKDLKHDLNRLFFMNYNRSFTDFFHSDGLSLIISD